MIQFDRNKGCVTFVTNCAGVRSQCVNKALAVLTHAGIFLLLFTSCNQQPHCQASGVLQSSQVKITELFYFLKAVLGDSGACGRNSPDLYKQWCLLWHNTSCWLNCLSGEERGWGSGWTGMCLLWQCRACGWVPGHGYRNTPSVYIWTKVTFLDPCYDMNHLKTFVTLWTSSTPSYPRLPGPLTHAAICWTNLSALSVFWKTWGRICKDCQD